MAMKKKEICPYCGRKFININLHKCKLKRDAPEKAMEFKKVDIEVPIEEIKENKNEIERAREKKEVFSESDIISESHSETVRFISKFFKSGTIKLTKDKDKKVIRDLLKNPVDSFKLFVSFTS